MYFMAITRCHFIQLPSTQEDVTFLYPIIHFGNAHDSL